MPCVSFALFLLSPYKILKRYLEQPTLLESLSARSLGAQRYMKRLYSQIKLWSEVGSEVEWYIADSSAYVVRV